MGAGVTCVQDMMYVYSADLGWLQVQLSTVLEMDNQGTIDLANGWSRGGCARHVDVCIHYGRKFKEAPCQSHDTLARYCCAMLNLLPPLNCSVASHRGPMATLGTII